MSLVPFGDVDALDEESADVDILGEGREAAWLAALPPEHAASSDKERPRPITGPSFLRVKVIGILFSVRHGYRHCTQPVHRLPGDAGVETVDLRPLIGLGR